VALDRNPYHVLGLPPDCAAMDVERACQKTLAMLAVGFDGATTYATPFGPRTRDADLVRWAAAELRDPKKRAAHARLAAPIGGPGGDAVPDDRLAPWAGALAAFGWGPR
jgi:hypothetical protein